MNVIVRYTDGKMIKGVSRDFFPNKDRFIVTPHNATDGETTEVFTDDLKAVFFVRDFEGNATYRERKRFEEDEEGPPLFKVKVTFHDDEVMIGSTMRYDQDRLGFFLFPVDSNSNNIKTFVVSSAVKRIHFL